MPEGPTDTTTKNVYTVRVTGPGLVLEQQINAETVQRVASLLISPNTAARRGRPPGSTRTTA